MLATDVVLPAPGAYLATMTTAARVERLKGPSFNSYLVEEGLDWVLTARRAAGVSEETDGRQDVELCRFRHRDRLQGYCQYLVDR